MASDSDHDSDNDRDEAYWCEQVFRDYEFSVVRLHSDGNDPRIRGNGFIVHITDCKTRCLIVSCEHVVRIVPVGGYMAAYFSNSVDQYNARVLYTDADRDLALLWAENVLEPMVALKFFDSPYASGWNVIGLSFIALGRSFPIAQPGTFIGHITNEPDEEYLACSCTSKEGTSGSPLILANVNEVVGVLAGASHASVYAVRVRTVREFLGGWLGGGDMNMPIIGMVTLAALKQE